MIQISQIDDKLKIYKENKVIVCGSGIELLRMISLLSSLDISIFAVCYYNHNYNRKNNDFPEISMDGIMESKDENFVIQIAANYEVENNIINVLNKKITSKYILTQEANEILGFVKKYAIAKQTKCAMPTKIIDETQIARHKVALRSFFLKYYDCAPVVMCFPFKTGDYTVKGTLEKNGVIHYTLPHEPRIIELDVYKKICNKVKIITAVREPIGQNLSLVFQFISALNSSRECDTFSICESTEVLLKDGGDAQYFFDTWLKSVNCLAREQNCDGSKIISGIGVEQTSFPFHMQKFIPSFQANIIDILAHPFDKEKGYSIIEEDNVEVFVYQLEKLNDIISEFSEWVGVSFDKLENANIGADKWTGKAYKKAQKEITFSKEYFDACFIEPYVKHFYSDDDIEKFKARWRPHIK